MYIYICVMRCVCQVLNGGDRRTAGCAVVGGECCGCVQREGPAGVACGVRAWRCVAHVPDVECIRVLGFALQGVGTKLQGAAVTGELVMGKVGACS